MSLAARVAKLESIQTRVLRCPWCRFALHSRVPTAIETPVERADVLPTKCWFCGTKFVVPLPGLNARQREVLDLIYNSHPTKQFIDERVHAAGIWSYLYGSEVKKYERAKQGQTAQASQEHSNYNRTHGSETWRDAKAKREGEELEQRALEFHQAQTERFKRLAGTSNSFPLDQALERIEKEYPTSSYDKAIDDIILSLGLEKYSQSASHLRSALAVCNLHLQNLKKREACEIVIWGEALPETVLEIGFFEEQKQREITETLPARLVAS
jgi:hypothetical protein